MSVPPLHHLASLTLRNGPEAPGVEVGDSKYFPRQIGLIHGPAAIPLLALGKAASDSGPRPQAPPPSRPSAPELPQQPAEAWRRWGGRCLRPGCLGSCLEHTGIGLPRPSPLPCSYRHDQWALRGWPPWLWSPAGHWPRDPPAAIPGPRHSGGSGESPHWAPAPCPSTFIAGHTTCEPGALGSNLLPLPSSGTFLGPQFPHL